MYSFSKKKKLFNFSADSCLQQPNLCNGNGFCIVNNNGSASCSCFDDFSGLTCAFNRTRCAISPSLCLNNGTCYTISNNIDGFYCDCPSPWTGKFCQSNITKLNSIYFKLYIFQKFKLFFSSYNSMLQRWYAYLRWQWLFVSMSVKLHWRYLN